MILGFLATAAVEAAGYFVAAAAFALIYWTRRGGLFHLAQSGVMLLAVGAFNTAVWRDMPFWGAVALGIGAGSMSTAVIEVGVYRILRRRGATPDEFLLVSFGLMLALQQAAALWLGTKALHLPAHAHVTDREPFLGALLTANEIRELQTAAAVAVVFGVLLAGPLGRSLDALRESALVYDWRGGRSGRVLVSTALLSGALAAGGAILDHLDHKVEVARAPFNYLLAAFVVVIVAHTARDRIAALVPARIRRSTWERASLVPLMCLAALLLAAIRQIMIRYGDPQWYDSVFLTIAIGCLVGLPGRRITRGEEEAAT